MGVIVFVGLGVIVGSAGIGEALAVAGRWLGWLEEASICWSAGVQAEKMKRQTNSRKVRCFIYILLHHYLQDKSQPDFAELARSYPGIPLLLFAIHLIAFRSHDFLTELHQGFP